MLIRKGSLNFSPLSTNHFYASLSISPVVFSGSKIRHINTARTGSLHLSVAIAQASLRFWPRRKKPHDKWYFCFGMRAAAFLPATV